MKPFSRADRFLGLDRPLSQAKWVLFGIPMDFTASFQPGSRFGPPRIREASLGLETYSLLQDGELSEINAADAGDLELPFGNVEKSLEMILAAAREILAEDRKFFALGGDHLVSLPLITAALEKHPDLVVLHWDAHADLRDEYLGERFSHATVLRRVAERLKPGHLYQLGIRSATRDEVEYARRHHFYPEEVAGPLEAIWPELAGRPVYLTFDIDVIDPAFVPGTGTPEPGGITATEALAALRRLRGLNLVSMDLVEAMPAADISRRTALLGAKLVREALLAVSAQASN